MSEDGSILDYFSTDIIDTLEDFAENPGSFIAEIIVGWIFGAWNAFLNYLGIIYYGDGEWVGISNVPEEVILPPLEAAGSAIMVIPDSWEWYGDMVMDIAEPAGLLAPAVTVFLWGVGMVALSMLMGALLKILETYLPIEPIIDPFRDALESTQKRGSEAIRKRL